MIITNAKYNKDQENINSSINCVINGQAMSVPLDPDNTHYQAILEWAKIDANSIEAADQRYFPFYKY